jgi:hypothetical protein
VPFSASLSYTVKRVSYLNPRMLSNAAFGCLCEAGWSWVESVVHLHWCAQACVCASASASASACACACACACTILNPPPHQVRSAKRRATDTYLKDSRMERVSRWQEERLLQIPAEAEVLKKKAEEEAAARAQVLRAD